MQQITYNAFKKPVDILEDNKGHVSFEYGPMMNRTVAYYGGLNADKDDLRYKKNYSSIMPVEIVNDDNSSKFITYIGGDAYTAPIAHIKKGSIDEYHYLHRDYLGSILAITDSSANIVEQTHFGAWGKVEQFSSSTGATTFNYESSLLGRGYTGHEHFISVGLIHMNGRIYDANLGRFLSPDNYIQDPYNSQSFNRFGYVWNNPLKYTDPSGEELLAIIIGAIVGAYIGGTVANGGELNPFAWKWDGDTWKGVIIGAILGAIVGESLSALIIGEGAKAFGIFTVKVEVFVPGVASIGLANTNSLGSLDLTWSTVAGGSGTKEDFIKLPEQDEAQIPLVNGPRVNVYVEGDYGDWVITADEYIASFVLHNIRAPKNWGSIEIAPNIEGNENISYTGLSLSMVGAGATFGNDALKGSSFRLYNQRGTNFSPKLYSSSWGGGSAGQIKTYGTGGIRTGLQGFGYGLGLYNAYDINAQHSAGQIGTFSMAIEQGSNLYSTLGGLMVLFGV